MRVSAAETIKTGTQRRPDSTSTSMLPIVARRQSMDGTLAQFIGVPFAALCGLQDSYGNDFAIHFWLTDILKRLTCQVVRLVDGGYVLWIKGQILERRIRIRHDSPG
jgi:hypothetical protein